MIDEDDNYTYKAGFSSDSSRIHVQKLDPGLRDYLMSIGMAHRDRKWLSINSRLSGFYMYCLATEMSERMNTPLLTDVIGENWGSGQALHFDSFGRDGKYVTETLVSLGIRVPGPQDLQRIPVNIFGKFLHEHRDERTLFRELVIDIMNNLRALEDNNQVRDYLESEKRKLESATENLKKDLEAIGILTVNNIAKITLPAIGASVTALAAPPVAPFVIGAGVFGVGAALCLASSRITDRRQLLLPIRSHAS
ncbi:MAG: hypothetical protein KC800_00630 [Candidatus Eremiobacteraeota bacterium]|nr:hypothetical protein [Candidatus Eremiobacteraeota bacterium]